MAQTRLSDFPDLGFGLGLRSPHYHGILDGQSRSQWFEALSENYMGLSHSGLGRPFKMLERIRQKHPVVLHGVSLSIASTDPLNTDYLTRLKKLIDAIQPLWISDHLCWTGFNRQNLHDLLPIPYTNEAITHVVSRIQQVQDFLKRRIMLENVSSYAEFAHSEMPEWEFVREVVNRADCGLLLDVNNIYVSSFNHGFNPLDYLNAIPLHRVGQIHLAGYSHNETHIVDTHDHSVSQEVWSLFKETISRTGSVSTMIEWDDKIPKLETLELELDKARAAAQEVLSKREYFPGPFRENLTTVYS